MSAGGVEPGRGFGPSPPARVPVLVYIAGAHRSGATPLGAILAGHPSIFYGGEMYRFPHPIFDVPDPARGCSCGASVETCPFWEQVRTQLDAEPGTLRALRAGQLRFERWRGLPRTLWRWFRADDELREHVHRMGRFIRILADTTGATTVVESSYNPWRGFLYRHPASGVDVRFVHLVRDGRSFIASERISTDPPEVPWRWLRATPVIVGRWISYHVLSWVLLRRRGRYMRVSYEQFVRAPGPTLRRIGVFIGIDLSSVIERVERGEPIPMRHIAAGNRMRLLGSIRLDLLGARSPELGPVARGLFWVMGGWLALLLGYRPGTDPTVVPPAPLEPAEAATAAEPRRPAG
jgi:hypothetical protein